MRVPPLVAAKLAAPVPAPGFVDRERLYHRLDAVGPAGATVVAGPPGVGKSALLAGWTTARSGTVDRAWVNADADDTSARLLRHVAHALGAEVGAADVHGVVGRALRRRRRRLVLVVDDVHLVRCRHALDSLRGVLDDGVPDVRLVLVGRTDPQVGLRWDLAADDVLALGPDDLELTEEEADRMVAARQPDLPGAARSEVTARADGWVAALHLALAGLASSADPVAAATRFGARTSSLADYVVAEVLDPLPADLHEIVASASVLDVWTPQTCPVVTGREDAFALLADLVAGNGLLARSEPGSLRCHPLVLDLLRRRLRIADEPRYRRLQRVAAAAVEREGDIEHAVTHLVEAHAPRQLLELCQRHIPELARSETATAVVRDEVHLLPETALPGVDEQLVVAELQLRAGDPGGCVARLERCPLDLTPSQRARAAALRSRCHHHLGNPAAALDSAREARRLAGTDDPGAPSTAVDAAFGLLWDGRVRSAARALAAAPVDDPMAVGLAARLAAEVGELGVAEVLARSALGATVDEAGAPGPHALHARLAHAQVLVERAADRGAGEAVEALLADARKAGAVDVVLVAGELLARLRWTDIGVAAGLGVLDRLPRRGRGGPLDPALQARLDRAEVRLLVEARALPEAAVLLDRLAGPEADILRARLAGRRGDVDEARRLLDGVPTDERPVAVEAARARLRVLVDAGADDVVPAAARDLLAHPAATRQLRRLLEEGEGVRSALAAVPGHGAALAVVLERLHDATLATTLSQREQTILEYLPTRLTSQEIGDLLYISANTVKTHLKNLYRRLEVSRRDDAVRRARQLGLLPPEHADVRALRPAACPA